MMKYRPFVLPVLILGDWVEERFTEALYSSLSPS
jgi:hypothetical protein